MMPLAISVYSVPSLLLLWLKWGPRFINPKSPDFFLGFRREFDFGFFRNLVKCRIRVTKNKPLSLYFVCLRQRLNQPNGRSLGLINL